MLNWYELEETAGLAQQTIADAGDNAMRLEEAGMFAQDEESSGIRRAVASAFISLGARIDRQALADEQAA